MKSKDDHDFDTLFERVGDILAWLPGIEECPDFRKVTAAYLAGYHPPVYEYSRSLGYSFTEDDVVGSCRSLILRLHELRSRAMSLDAGDSSAGAEWDRHWRQTKDSWKQKQSELVNLLRDAANLFESGQADARMFPTVAGYKALRERCGQGGVDDTFWPGVENLRRWAAVVKEAPVEVVFPAARQQPPGWRVGEAGERGRAFDGEGGFRALAVRAIAEYVPESTIFRQRFSVISGLAGFIGIDATRQNVRSILMKGCT
ncbi:MAG: hypothetical protein PHT19_16770 [Methylococcus sp.]|nr:hypothetical protein [Methylococcus sp.]